MVLPTYPLPHIRWMIRRDMPEVLAIEQQSFEHPWTADDFRHQLSRRNSIGMVAERDELIVGYMVYDLHKRHLQLLNFAVLPDCRRTGVGRCMVDKLVSKLRPQRRNSILLEIRETNLAAQRFFSRQGWRATAVVRGHYADTQDDAYVFELRLPPDPNLAAESRGLGRYLPYAPDSQPQEAKSHEPERSNTRLRQPGGEAP